MATATKTTAINKTAKATTGKTTGSKLSKAEDVPELIESKVENKEQIAASAIAISADEIPFVELPLSITLTKTALQKSLGAFSEAWDYEQEHQLGLELLRLVGRTIRDIGSPLLLLLIYGGAVAAEKANTDDAKQTRSERWQRLLRVFSRHAGTLDGDELEIAEDAATGEDSKKATA